MEKRKRYKMQLTVDAENYETLRRVGHELGWGTHWLSREIDRLLGGLVLVVEQAKKDAEKLSEETDQVRKDRYRALMEKAMTHDR